MSEQLLKRILTFFIFDSDYDSGQENRNVRLMSLVTRRRVLGLQPDLVYSDKKCRLEHADYFCRQFGPRSGQTKCQGDHNPNCLTLIYRINTQVIYRFTLAQVDYASLCFT